MKTKPESHMSESLDIRMPAHLVSTAYYDGLVVGAGPYGLATAVHLLAYGLEVGIFGKPLQFWREHMPKGMLLRSFWWATGFSDPHQRCCIEQYFRETGQQPFDPLPAETIVKYGLWFQKQVVPNVDETYVKTIEREKGQFVLTLADGRVIHSPVVVMAPGLCYYTYCPAESSHLSPNLVSHSSDHRTFDRFAGKSVVIIGGGQSALETAFLSATATCDER